ncbi:MAG TPA: LytR C-terminal domain-containing protein [Cryptosporangiaceae bacterium]|nr:LytR C-terminal domain-containing protein [Cryptosporangiaceae bacterium]
MSLARVRALVVLGVLTFVALVSVVWAMVTDSRSEGTVNAACATASAAAIPAPKTVKVRVFNATDRPGLATTVRKALGKRGFVVIEVGNDPQAEEVTKPALIRYGPKGVGAAQLLRAHFTGAEIQDDERKDATIDIVLGPQYTDLTPQAEVKAQLADLPPPPVTKVEGC